MMAAWLAMLRCGLLVVLAAALSACSGIYIEQPGSEAIVRVGSHADPKVEAARIAGHFMPYTLLALRAYDESSSASARWADLTARPGSVGRQAKDWLSDWQREFHHIGRLACERGASQCGVRLGGLGYQVWRRKDCSEIVIAFRGTDFNEAVDWISNFRWFLRLLPIHDQYEQVQDAIPRVLDSIQASYCRGRTPRLTAVGHSLGGGLAQTAAYTDSRIRQVYGIDPTFVTGYYDAHINSRTNARGLKIDRLYEHGEILAFGRFVIRRVVPTSPCNPQIRDTRFNLIYDQDIITQHNLVELSVGLLGLAGSRRDWERRKKLPLPDAPEAADPVRCPAQR